MSPTPPPPPPKSTTPLTPSGAAQKILEVERHASALSAGTLLVRPRLVLPHAVGIEALAQRFFAELVVEASLLRIAQDFVRSIDVFELRLGGLVAWVLVRVELRRELSILLLDLIGGR